MFQVLHHDNFSKAATGRDISLLGGDLSQNWAALEEQISGSRVLVVGGAGSIGGSTIEVLSRLSPASLHVIDQNENALADLVRQLRSRPEGLDVKDFRCLPLDFGNSITRAFLLSQDRYDFVLNFAAIKHVRSEKDVYSVLQMLDTNINKQAHFMQTLGETGFTGKMFVVSTDKAANPSSFMGASKRALEHVIFSNETAADLGAKVSSARFANVAFSNGSLLQAFEQRLRRSQPLSVPADVRRYFVSMQEAGELCTLASLCVEPSTIVVPKLDPEKNLVLLQDVAEKFLRLHGLEPVLCETEEDARLFVRDVDKGKWPLLVTPLDTAGEKPFEEFIAQGEKPKDVGLQALQGVAYQSAPEGKVAQFLSDVKHLINEGSRDVTFAQLQDCLTQLEPAFASTHKKSEKNLDQRM